MALLALTTSTHRGGVAVLADDGRLVEVVYGDLRAHAERLFEGIDAALADADVRRADLTAVACDVGPGSFTGVRVGVAAAKGIALALRVPLVPITSLEAMAWAAFDGGLAGPERDVIAVIDAKKGELFAAAYRSEGGEVVARQAPTHLPPDQVVALARSLTAADCRGPMVVGEAATVAAGLLAFTSASAAGAVALPAAGALARLAARRLRAGTAPDAADVEPLYVRAPDAKPWPGAPPAR